MFLAKLVEPWVSWLWGYQGGGSDHNNNSGGGLEFITMDTLNTLLLGWLFSALFILVLAKFLYDKFLRGVEEEELTVAPESNVGAALKSSDSDSSTTKSSNVTTSDSHAPNKLNKSAANVDKRRRVPSIVPKGRAVSGTVGPAAGQDADAVRWINTVTKWLYRGPHDTVSGPYLALLNELTVATALETGVLIEVLEILPATPSPTLSNIVVDCFPDDSMNITCDCHTRLYLRLQTTRTQADVTSESEYAVAVDPFIGRINADVSGLNVALKFDGWPEVVIELEGIRDNEEGLGEKELQEVVKEVLSSALRSMMLDISLEKVPTFPPFKRARELPENVIPVGYDSMVREHQTHPPLLKAKATPKTAVTSPLVPSASTPHNVSLKEHAVGSYSKPIVVLEDNLDYDVLKPSRSPISNNINDNGFLTQNVSASLSHSEEQLINKNINQYCYEQDEPDAEMFLDERDEYEFSDRRLPYDKGYVPPGFLEQVTAVALAKVSEKSLTALKHSNSQEKDSDLSRENSVDETKDIPIFDYIPYDSEYEEDEDLDDYLEKKPGKKETPSLKSPFERQPVKPKPSTEAPDAKKATTVAAEETFPSKSPVCNQQSVPLGAMGLPHHPKSHFAQTLVPAPPPPGLAILNGKRLLVKVVRASGIGGGKSSVDCYVVVEMDEPSQRFTTAVAKDTSSPFWDEPFLFDLSDSTLELLFELYDEADGVFLGLGIVGIEELVATPSQRQIIPLQARPYEDDQVSGSLTVEFLFLEGGVDLPDLTELALRNSAVQRTRGPQGDVLTTTTTYTKLPEPSDHYNVTESSSPHKKNSVAEAALRDIADKTATTTAASRSTLIIHASKKPEDDLDQQDPDDSDDNYIVNTLQYPYQDTLTTATTAATKPNVGAATVTSPATSSPVTTGASDTLDETLDYEDDGRGRKRSKGRSFFGSLKKRFSRSKQRSQSVDPTSPTIRETTPTDAPRTATVGRSVSMERSSRLRPTGLLSVPKSDGREPGTRSDTGSTRSSLSETSGLSSSSTRTYVNEASMLIVETVENGVVKHYLVPVSLQQRNKWRKRGTKLHVFSGHTFVAKHISSSMKCSVCDKAFNRRPGKQGYECRDCQLISHKPCHVRTETSCPNSKVNNMDLVYIKDPREERKANKTNSWM